MQWTVSRLATTTLVALIGLVLGALAMLQRRLIYPGAYGGPVPSAGRQVPGAAMVTLVASDGERLFAFWRPPEPGCGVVVSFHGNASLPETHATRFLSGPWRANGWGVLAPAYRGYPGSTGTPSEAGLVADGAAALRFVEDNAPGRDILLHGHSLGAAVAVAASRTGRHHGLYLEAPFDALLHLVRLRFPCLPSALLRDPWRSDQRIGTGTAPVLIVHGDDDPVIPAVLAKALAEAAGPRARFALLAGDHVSILGQRDDSAEAWFRRRGPCEAPTTPP